MPDIKKGAEAVVTLESKRVVKNRLKKNYRNAILDSDLRIGRTKREAKLMSLAKKAGVPTPFITDVNLKDGIIEMTRVEGDKLKDVLNEFESKKRLKICRTVGGYIVKLHKNHIIHGDLTTSNIMLAGDRVVFIDFGLGEINESIESKGVDLLLFKKALDSAHWKVADECFKEAVAAYFEEFDRANEVLERLKVIERRGRYVSERR